MKSTSIIFIILNSINKHLFHASQMHTHAYIWRVRDSEPYSGIQGTFMDPYGPQHVYALCGHLSLLFSIFFLSYFFPKDIIIPISSTIAWQTFPIITASCMTSPPYILLFTPYSPVICKDNFPLVYMYKLSRYYTVFQLLIWVLFSLGHQLSKSWHWLHCSHQAPWLLLPVTSWSYH